MCMQEPSSTFHLMFDTGGTGASDKAAKGEVRGLAWTRAGLRPREPRMQLP